MRPSIQAIALATAVLALACGPAAAPPASAPAKPAPAAAAPPSTGGSGGPAPATDASPAWQAEWDRTLAAARQEGSVVVNGPAGDTIRRAMVDGFQKAYP